jgi:microcystin-dependent protein
MPGLQIITTKAGRAALVNAEHNGTAPLTIAEIGITAAVFTADGDMTALPGEIKRIRTISGEVVAADTMHVTIRDDGSDTYTVRGIGYWLSNGVLLGVYSQPEPILQKSTQSMMLLAADTVFTTLSATSLTFGDANFTNPPASTERQGVIELATIGETQTGTDAVRAITPVTLSARIATEARTGLVSIATQVEADAGMDDQHAITAKKLAQRLTRFAPLDSPALIGMPTAPTPANGDNSLKLANTAFVQKAIAQAVIGQIVFEARTSARAGYLKLNGALVNRADYPDLWAYAQASGTLIAEATWANGNWGCFSTGDGASTFRIPELRGEMLRCWDDGRGVDAARGIGTWQDSQNRTHGHTASAAAVGDHIHSGWTDAQGWHGHHGGTTWAGDHAHSVASSPGNGQGASGGNSVQQSGGAMATSVAGGHSHAFDTEGAGNHAHNIGIGGAGNHTHAITVNLDGGNEARPRNLAMLAMIRAYSV